MFSNSGVFKNQRESFITFKLLRGTLRLFPIVLLNQMSAIFQNSYVPNVTCACCCPGVCTLAKDNQVVQHWNSAELLQYKLGIRRYFSYVSSGQLLSVCYCIREHEWQRSPTRATKGKGCSFRRIAMKAGVKCMNDMACMLKTGLHDGSECAA